MQTKLPWQNDGYGEGGGWRTVERPGYQGKLRDTCFQEWDETFGKGNWRMVWKIRNQYVGRLGAYLLYEDAYFLFLQEHPDVLKQLITEARDVYDDEPSNVNSGLDYMKQETKRTHLQDIAIRRSLVRMGLWFKGTELIRIRQEMGPHPLSMILGPGKIPFHRPDLIEKPELLGWWDPGTVEAFYQSGKVLQVRT